MVSLNVKINRVDVVKGSELCGSWKIDMVRVHTDAGVFIDEVYNLQDWVAMIGTTPRIGIQPCWRTNKHTWVHLLKG